MVPHSEISRTELFNALLQHQFKWAGNKKLKIYGTLQCQSGKRMNVANRVFFNSEDEALKHGYRPCGHCMRKAYINWKKEASEHQ